MATFRKRNAKWQAIVRHKSIGTLAKTFPSKLLAQRWSGEQELRLANGSFGKLLPDAVNLKELLIKYRDTVTPQKRGQAQEHRRINRLLSDPISTTEISQLSSQLLANFRDRRLKDGVRASQYDLVIIRHCIKVAIGEWGLLLENNPAERIKLPPSPKPRERRLKQFEFDRLKAASKRTTNQNVWPVVVFAIETGMRRGEILSLKWESICFDNQIASLAHTKNGSSRNVPLSSKALCVLSEQRERGTALPFPINDNAFRLAWDRLRARAGITDLRFHDLRHEAISRFFEQDLSIAEVAAISGHKDPRMLFRYTHLDAIQIAKKLR